MLKAIVREMRFCREDVPYSGSRCPREAARAQGAREQRALVLAEKQSRQLAGPRLMIVLVTPGELDGPTKKTVSFRLPGSDGQLTVADAAVWAGGQDVGPFGWSEVPSDDPAGEPFPRRDVGRPLLGLPE